MNIANKLTFTRIILIPVMAVLYFCGLNYIAAAVFVIAVLTDILDPIADKMINITALLLLMWSADSSGAAGMLLTVCTIIITAREFTVTGFRVIAATNRVVIAADKLGKIKTVVQDIAIVFLMIENWPFCLVNIPGDYILLIAATVLTIISGINYIVKNRGVFRESK